MEIIAELGSNWWHPERERAQRLVLDSVWQAARAGATIIKLQLFRANELYARARAGLDEAGNHKLVGIYQRIQELEFPLEWLRAVRHECDQARVKLWASVFSGTVLEESVDYLQGLKIASGDIDYYSLVAQAAKLAGGRNLPLCISTGAAMWWEIEQMLNYVRPYKRQVILMHCVSAYPAPEEIMNLRTIIQMRGIGMAPNVGLSDHSLGALSSQLALALGATYFEKHFRPEGAHPDCPDYGHSLGPQKFAEYVQALKHAERMLGKGKMIEFAPTQDEAGERVWARRGDDGLRPRI